jgi:DDE domain
MMTKISYGGYRFPGGVDAEGDVLDVLVQSRRNRRVALKLMRKLLKKYGVVPEQLATDDLRSYGAAALDLGDLEPPRAWSMAQQPNREFASTAPTTRTQDARVQERLVSATISLLTWQQSTTFSTSNAISPRTMLLGHRPCGPVVRSSQRREPDVPGDLLPARVGTVPNLEIVAAVAGCAARDQFRRICCAHAGAARKLAAKKIRHVWLGFQQKLRDLVLKRQTLFLQ